GWMMHAAWYLGRPYRVLMLTESHSHEWHPYLRTRNQDVQTSYRVRSGLFTEGDAPPLPEQPRRFTLVALLSELRQTGDACFLPVIRAALLSQDREIRRAAAEARSHLPGSEPALEQLLRDADFGVRQKAAAGLLRNSGSAAISPELLTAHVLIG